MRKSAQAGRRVEAEQAGEELAAERVMVGVALGDLIEQVGRAAGGADALLVEDGEQVGLVAGKQLESAVGGVDGSDGVGPWRSVIAG